MGKTGNHITETCYFPMEISIGGASTKTCINKALPLLFDKVEGVTVFHPGGNHGKGTLQLSVAGEEIFPKGFHARNFMYRHSSHHGKAFFNKQLDSYMHHFEERAKGSTVSIEYTEAANGDSGLLYLVFKLTRLKPCR